MVPEESVVVKQFDIFNRNASLGFPGLPHRLTWYAIRFEGYIEVPSCKDSECRFRLTSDDGAIFSIHGQQVVNHDGVHPPSAKNGKIKLLKGWHPFVMEWFQGPLTQIALALEMSTDGGSTYSVVPHTQFKFQVPTSAP
jgi:hypothetical protein